MKIVDKQNVFNKGIMTSKLKARDDLQQYTQGVADAYNFVLSKFGPITKRVGTKFIKDLGDPNSDSTLVPFVFSVDKSILLEFSAGKIRIYIFQENEIEGTSVIVASNSTIESISDDQYYPRLYISDTNTISDSYQKVCSETYYDEDTSSTVTDYDSVAKVYGTVELNDSVGYISNCWLKDSSKVPPYWTTFPLIGRDCIPCSVPDFLPLFQGNTYPEGCTSRNLDISDFIINGSLYRYIKTDMNDEVTEKVIRCTAIPENLEIIDVIECYHNTIGRPSQAGSISSFYFFDIVLCKDMSTGSPVYYSYINNASSILTSSSSTRTYSTGTWSGYKQSSLSFKKIVSYGSSEYSISEGTLADLDYVVALTDTGLAYTYTLKSTTDSTKSTYYLNLGKTFTAHTNNILPNKYDQGFEIREDDININGEIKKGAIICGNGVSYPSSITTTGITTWTSNNTLPDSLIDEIVDKDGAVHYIDSNFSIYKRADLALSDVDRITDVFYDLFSTGEYTPVKNTLWVDRYDSITSEYFSYSIMALDTSNNYVYIKVYYKAEDMSEPLITIKALNISNKVYSCTLGRTTSDLDYMFSPTENITKETAIVWNTGSSETIGKSDPNKYTRMYIYEDTVYYTTSALTNSYIKPTYLNGSFINISETKNDPSSTLVTPNKDMYKLSETTSEEITYSTSLTSEQINNMSYVQSLDVLYLAFADGKTKPKEFRRYSDTHWKLMDFETEDGPYGDTNYDQSKKVKLSSHKSKSNLKASGTKITYTDANNAKQSSPYVVKLTTKGWNLTKNDIGRQIRINFATYNKDTVSYEDHWTWGKLVGYINSTTMAAEMYVDNSSVKDNGTTIGSSTTTYEWRLSAWSDELGYPTKVTIHNQRLSWAGVTDRPWLWMSNSFAYTHYAPSNYDGEITDKEAINQDLSTDKISRINWMKSVKNLLIGTEFEELRIMSSGASVSPSDVAVLREASYGSYNTEPVITEDVVIFIQRLQRSIRALAYDYYRDAFLGPNLALFAEDLTLGGINKIVYQKEPYSVLWVLKNDGTLLACTYDKEQEVTGMTRCELANGGIVKDIQVLPSSSAKQDILVLVVERTINGEKKRYLEMLTPEYLSTTSIEDVVFMDSSIHAVSDTEFTTIDSLSHLEGEEVSVVEKGVVIGKYTVKDGTITLDKAVKNVWVGLPYDAFFTTLERDFGDKQLSTHNAKTRIFKLYFTLLKTLGMTVSQLDDGNEFNLIVLDPMNEDPETVDSVSARKELDFQSTWTNDIMNYSMRINAIPALPCTVAGITTGIEINAL